MNQQDDFYAMKFRAEAAEAELAQARAELAALKEANRWIPINGRFCLVLRITNSNVTHWRYLPEPPEVSE